MKIAALAHSKHRNMFGLVGIEVNEEQKKAYVKLARQWSRDQINTIPSMVSQLYQKIQWGDTYVDQQTGEHLIQDLRKEGMYLKIITTQKNLKDPSDISRTKVMDKIEMVQLMLTLRKNHQIEFPKNPTTTMVELERQMAIFSEHKTEAGGIDYFAPGEELDNLTKALLIDCFAARNVLLDNTSKTYSANKSFKKGMTEEFDFELPDSYKVISTEKFYY